MINLLFAVSVMAGQSSSTVTSPQKTSPPSNPPAGVSVFPITFENTLPQSKIDFVLHSSISAHRYSIETMTGGVAAFDYDNDGLLDLFFTNGAEIPSLIKSDPKFSNRLYHNNGDGTFTDVTAKTGVAGISPPTPVPHSALAGSAKPAVSRNDPFRKQPQHPPSAQPSGYFPDENTRRKACKVAMDSHSWTG